MSETNVHDLAAARRSRIVNGARQTRQRNEANGKHIYSTPAPTLHEVMAAVLEADRIAESFYAYLQFWKRLARSHERELHKAKRKLALLERQLARLRAETV